MADPIPDPDVDHSTRIEPGSNSAPRTPRWVIILGIVALILILAFIAQFVLGIRHGPGMHG